MQFQTLENFVCRPLNIDLLPSMMACLVQASIQATCADAVIGPAYLC